MVSTSQNNRALRVLCIFFVIAHTARGSDSDTCNPATFNSSSCALESVQLYSDSNCTVNDTSVTVTLNVSGALNGTCSQIGSNYFSYTFGCDNISISYFSDSQCTSALADSSLASGANNDQNIREERCTPSSLLSSTWVKYDFDCEDEDDDGEDSDGDDGDNRNRSFEEGSTALFSKNWLKFYAVLFMFFFTF